MKLPPLSGKQDSPKNELSNAASVLDLTRTTALSMTISIARTDDVVPGRVGSPVARRTIQHKKLCRLRSGLRAPNKTLMLLSRQ
jgi:hypothetical protein